MKPLYLIALLAIAVLMIAGCGSEVKTVEPANVVTPSPYPPEAKWGDLPTAKSNLYFAKDQDGDGGYFGLPGFPIGSFDDTWIGKSPGWEYVNGHVGGVGNTLQVVNHEIGIEMCWAYNDLYLIILTEGWQGQIQTGITELTGIRLGSKASNFLAKFPDAKASTDISETYGAKSYTTMLIAPPDPIYHRKSTNRKVVAFCDKNDVIIGISLSNFSPEDMY